MNLAHRAGCAQVSKECCAELKRRKLKRDAKRYGRERDARHHVSHGDRLKIRELEMEKSSLSKSLTRGSKSYGQTSAIRSQIRGIDRQIEQLRAPKW